MAFHWKALRRYCSRLFRRGLDVAAVCIFVYSLWFYISSPPGTVVTVRKPAKVPRIQGYEFHDVGKPIAKEMLFSSEEDEEEDGQEEEEEERILDNRADVVKQFHEEQSNENNESFGEGFDKIGNPISNDTSAAQKRLNYIAEYLAVSLVVTEAGRYNELMVTMSNSGHERIERGNWYIVLCQSQDGIMNKYGVPIAKGKFRLLQIEGNIFILDPYDDFKALAPSDSFSFFLARIHAASDIYSNWYVAQERLSPRIIASTAGRFTADFSNIVDKSMPPEKRYTYNKAVWVEKLKDIVNVVPTPFEVVSKHPKLYSVGQWSDWVILYTEEVEFEAKFLSAKLGGLTLQNYDQQTKFIQITTGRVKNHKEAEAYNLFHRPDQESITVIGNTASGAFYGIQTFLGIISHKGSIQTELPELSITDYPRMPFRGLMVDVSRSFIKKRDILRLIDVMAMYKVNKLHFHLSDDQGWRLEIPGLEELTQVGSRRIHDMEERAGLHPYLGAGPHGNTHGSGYYSVQDYKDILLYAHQRHIQVIPELDLPGHAHAAIRSMEARTLNQVAKGVNEKDAMKYALKDPNDSSEYTAVNEYRETTVNPCMESTFTFLDHVISEIVNMHKDIQPLNSFHVGGDEVPKDALVQSPMCHKFRDQNPAYSTTRAIKRYFMTRAAGILASKNLTMQVWEDGIAGSEDNKTFQIKAEGIKVQVWKRGQKSRIYDLARRGFKVVLSEAEYLYLDHHYEDHLEERGFSWATDFVSMRKMFLYTPMSQSARIQQKVLANVIGMETTLWSETVRDLADLDMMIFPRLLVFAERAWHSASFESQTEDVLKIIQNKAWNQFANVLVQRELYRLESLGIKYYLPPPGIEMINGKVVTNTCLPGLTVQISSNKGKTWSDFTASSIVSPGRTAFATRSHNGRRSRTVWYKIPT